MAELHTDPKTNSWVLQTRGDPRHNITEPNRTYEWYHDVALGEMRPGEWEHFVYHTKWVYDSPSGFVELWRNGNKLVDLPHTGTAYNDGVPPCKDPRHAVHSEPARLPRGAASTIKRMRHAPPPVP